VKKPVDSPSACFVGSRREPRTQFDPWENANCPRPCFPRGSHLWDDKGRQSSSLLIRARPEVERLRIASNGGNSRSLKHSVAGPFAAFRPAGKSGVTPDARREWNMQTMAPESCPRVPQPVAWQRQHGHSGHSIRTMLQRLLQTCDVTRKESRRCSEQLIRTIVRRPGKVGIDPSSR